MSDPLVGPPSEETILLDEESPTRPRAAAGATLRPAEGLTACPKCDGTGADTLLLEESPTGRYRSRVVACDLCAGEKQVSVEMAMAWRVRNLPRRGA